MIREVNLLNRGNANLFVPKSEVLSAEATLSNLISFDSTFSLINISARSRCLIPRVRCGMSDAYTSLVILFDDCSVLGESHKV